MRRLLALLLVLGLGFAQEDKLKACFIYVGPVGDAGWTYAHDVGRKKAEAALPWLETRYVESVPEAQALPVIDRFVREGCRVIFAASFGYGEAVLEAAKKYRTSSSLTPRASSGPPTWPPTWPTSTRSTT